MLTDKDWTAQWIGRGEPGEIVPDVFSFADGRVSKEVSLVIPETRSPLFRREFRLEKPVRRARLCIAGLGLYELRLNGQKVGNQILTPAKTIYRQRILYDTYEVTSQLCQGANALGIMLGNGWFNGQKKYWGWQMQWHGYCV